MADRLLATRIDPGTLAAASWEDQERLAPPGAYQELEVTYEPGEHPEGLRHQLEYDVNCPGCGKVCHMRSPEWPIHRTKQGLTCDREVHFTRCCGWRGRLVDELWIRQGKPSWWPW